MTYDSLVNRGDYFSAHYLAEVFPKDLKSGLLAAWKTREEEARSSDSADQEPDPDALPVTPRLGLRALRRPYFRTRAFFAEAAITHDDATTYDAPEWRERATSSTPPSSAPSATTPSLRPSRCRERTTRTRSRSRTPSRAS